MDSTWANQYITCLYYQIQTMATAGIVQTNNFTEKIFNTLVVLILSGTFAYSFNVIGIVCQDIFQDEEILNRKLNDVSHYMQRRDVSKLVQSKVKKFIEYMHYEERHGSQRGRELVLSITPNL